MRSSISARRVIRLRWVGSALLLLGLASFDLHAAPVEVIVNSAQAGVTIDRTLLRAIFSLRLREWPGGVPIRVFVLPDDDPVSSEFCREKLGTYPYVLRAAWDRTVFTGTGLAPTVVRSEREMRERVMDTPGAIGYVSGDTSSRFLPLPDFSVASAIAGPAQPTAPTGDGA